MAVLDFDKFTRQKHAPLPAQAFAYGATLAFPIPRVGLLQGVIVTLRGTSLVLTGAANAFGYCSLARRLRLTLNSGIDLDNFSGPGYHYGIRPNLDNTFDPLPTPPNVTSTGRSAIASGQTFAVDFYIPVTPNLRDAIGLLMLQNEQTLATLNFECETQANIAGTTLTFTGTPSVTVYPVWMTLPARQEDMPDLSMLHQILEETTTIAAVGDAPYVWPRGNIYLQMLHLVTANVAGLSTATFTDSFSRSRIVVNQSDTLYDYDIPSLDVRTSTQLGQARIVGTIPFNFMASAGLGMYDKPRDTIDSANYTDLRTLITSTIAAGTIFHIRRQLVPLGGA